MVADDAAFFGEDEASVAGADMGDDGIAALHGGSIFKAATGF